MEIFWGTKVKVCFSHRASPLLRKYFLLRINEKKIPLYVV